MSSPVRAALPPFAGIAFLPLVTEATRAALPVATRGAHAALSPSLGALATPAAWHIAHVCSYTALPSAAIAVVARPIVARATRPAAMLFITETLHGG